MVTEVKNTPVRVYPMGFIPEVKKQLLDSVEAYALSRSKLSGIGETLKRCSEYLNVDDVRRNYGWQLGAFIETVRELDQLVKDGERASQEEKDFIEHALRTDEELAVIFAKVSRNPGGFEEISRSVTEEGAAQFHQKWVVSVEGYGHASVAEHAIMHMAVENVPSLDGDWITDNRLGSYTEFSARFKGRQGVGYFTPEAVAKDSRLSRRWHEVHQQLFSVHDQLMAKGLEYIKTDEAKSKQPDRRIRDKTVADQLKDLMSASRLTSIGVTMNAREAENTIRKFLSAPYPSINQLGGLFKEQSLRVAPTLVKYADRSEYMVATQRGLYTLAFAHGLTEGYKPRMYRYDDYNSEHLVDLIDYDHKADAKFIAAAVYSDPNTGNFKSLMDTLNLSMDKNEKKQIVKRLFDKFGRWDVPIRGLELPNDYLVEFPGMTYGMWREYKRHRMQSYFAKDLDVKFGFMIPPLVLEMEESGDPQYHGGELSIRQIMGQIEGLFNEVHKVDAYAAQYVVTRLHYRPAVAKFNIREAYHLIELRTGPTAHPFIRRLMWPLFDQINAVQPILMEYLGLRLNREGRPSRDFAWTV